MKIEILALGEMDKDAWNKDISNPTQLFQFANAKKSPKCNPYFLLIENRKKIFKWQFYVVGIYFFKYIEIISEPNIQESEFLEVALDEMLKKFRPFKINFNSITLSRFINKDFLRFSNFEITEHGSVVINLLLEREILFSNIHSKHRNVIRKAEKDGVSFYEDTSLAGLECFQKISIETYNRSGKKGLDVQYLMTYFNALNDSKNIRIFFVAINDIIQACAIYLVSNNLAIYWHGASIDNVSTGAANLLQWDSISKFQKEGVTFFDLGGISFDSDNEKAQSISKFKTRFGGEIVRCYGGEKIINSYKNLIYQGLKKWK